MQGKKSNSECALIVRLPEDVPAAQEPSRDEIEEMRTKCRFILINMSRKSCTYVSAADLCAARMPSRSGTERYTARRSRDKEKIRVMSFVCASASTYSHMPLCETGSCVGQISWLNQKIRLIWRMPQLP